MNRPPLQDGGTVKRDSLYVERAADIELVGALERGELCFVVGPRQAGKSSLRVRAEARLTASSARCVTIDLQRIDSEGVSAESWYRALAYEIAEQMALHQGWEDWWRVHGRLPTQTWSAFLREVLLAEIDGPIVVFVDEVDNLLPLPFADDFLASLRAIYTDRAEQPDLDRLTFCLIGSHSPARLVRDPGRTPLNLGCTILMEDFTREEMSQFLPAIRDLLPDPKTVLDRTFEWTDGHPYMTQRILVELLRKPRIIASRIHAEIQDVVAKCFLRSGRLDDASLSQGESRCLIDEPGAPALAKLQLYEQLLELGELDLDRQNPVQLSLRLAGLAASRPGEGGSRLGVRNAVFALVFDLDWVRERREGLRHRESRVTAVSEGIASASLESLTRTIDRLFCDPATAVHGPYLRKSPGSELIAGTLFRFNLQGAQRRLSLQVYKGLEGIGGELWEQEVRALVRLSSRNHSTIPRIIHGEYEKTGDADLAFILTEAASYTLADSGAIESLRGRPTEAVRQLALLAEGLTLLHGNGLMHRNLWLGAIEVMEEPDETLRLRYSRFEMASLIGNLLRRISRPSDVNRAEAEKVRDFFVQQGLLALACAPPERLAFVFQVAGEDMFEGPATDVFSLGVIAYLLFVGPLPEREVERTFPDGRYDAGAHRLLIAELHRRIGRAGLPDSLAEVLRKMIEPDWRTRWTSSELVGALAENWEEISQLGSRSEAPVGYLVTYFPLETGQVLRGWSLLGHDPSTPTGEEQLRDFIVEDLRNGLLTYSEHGFAPFVDNPDAKHYGAQVVLVGGRAAYFAAPYLHRAPWQKAGGHEIPQLLLIRFVTDRKRIWRLESNPFKRRLPPIRLVAPDEVEPDEAERLPSWEPLVRSVQPSKAPDWHLVMENALDWLLRLERVRLETRTYAVTVESTGGFSDLQLDVERDQQWLWQDSLRTLFARDGKRRPELGDFFERLAEDDSPRLLLMRDNQGQPSRDDQIVYEGLFDRTLDFHRIRVKWQQPIQHLPAKAWIQPLDDFGSRIQLQRQSRARYRLLEMPGLIDQLTHPAISIRLRTRWPEAGEGLSGDAPECVREMLDSWPFFALHGPPGTGKTTVVAHAVEQSLRYDAGQRILIAAQSHYALDNLGERILDRLGASGTTDVSALRIVASGSEQKVSQRMQALLPARLVRARIEQIEDVCKSRLENLEDPPEIREIVAQWRDEVSRSTVELQDRLRRGTNLLFSTTGSATDNYLGVGAYFDTFDWVIIEEAAKAWLTELAMPLVQGLRWTLVGDHKQLPAFGRAEVEAILQECAGSLDAELREHGRSRERYVEVFDLFGRLFRVIDEDPQQGSRHTKKSPVRRLTTQYRMRRPIAETVSQAFYDGKLRTAPSADHRQHGFRTPPWLTGESLVWVDTSDMVDAREMPLWKNPAEADLVRRIAGSLQAAASAQPMNERLAVLSPYLAQVRLLEDGLRADSRFATCVHTVDSFQGREADIVVVSLVRCNDERNLIRRLGFLAYPQRINVLFSRARCLLIIVGAFAHFQATDGTFWTDICRSVLTHGKRLSAAELGLIESSQEFPT